MTKKCVFRMILLLLLFIFLILKGNKITIHELGLGDKEN